MRIELCASICKRQYCKYKHRKEEESIENEFDQREYFVKKLEWDEHMIKYEI